MRHVHDFRAIKTLARVACAAALAIAACLSTASLTALAQEDASMQGPSQDASATPQDIPEDSEAQIAAGQDEDAGEEHEAGEANQEQDVGEADEEGAEEGDGTTPPGFEATNPDADSPAAAAITPPTSSVIATKASALAAMSTQSWTLTELRSGKNRTASPVPAQTICIDGGGTLPLSKCNVSGSAAGLQYASHWAKMATGFANQRAIWITNPKKDSTLSDSSGLIVLKWTNVASDSAGRRLDFTLTVTRIQLKLTDKSKKSARIMLFIKSIMQQETANATSAKKSTNRLRL